MTHLHGFCVSQTLEQRVRRRCRKGQRHQACVRRLRPSPRVLVLVPLVVPVVVVVVRQVMARLLAVVVLEQAKMIM